MAVAGSDGATSDSATAPHVVIVGAGFGGLNCARGLGDSGAKVTVIDRRNYHLFVPLLYQVATAALSPAEVAEPIRKILRQYQNIEVVLGDVVSIDRQAKTVGLSDDRVIPYDELVVATGSDYNYFGRGDWAALAPGLKTLESARQIRHRLLMAFEQAEMSLDPARQQALMTTVIIGGGPTGVEMAGAAAQLARNALAGDFRHIDPRLARIILLEAGPRILSAFPEDLAAYAGRKLADLGVEVVTDRSVEEVEDGAVTVAGEKIFAGTIIWAAGIKASPVGTWLDVPTDRVGRVEVAPDLSVKGTQNVYVIGDSALAFGADGAPLPGLAQVASQQGTHLGKALATKLRDGTPPVPFVFNNRGNTAVIGRHAAIFDFGRYKLKGVVAWLLWAVVHIYLLIGFQKRLLVSIQWLWHYVTYDRNARLISEYDCGDRPSGPRRYGRPPPPPA